MSAIAALLLAQSALAASRPPPPPPPPRNAHPAPLRTAPPRSPPASSGAHGSHRAGAVISQPIAPPPATPPPAQPGRRRQHHHHPRFFGPDCAQTGACDQGYPPEISVDAPPVEHWDDPVDESIPGFDEPAEPLAPPPDLPPPPVDCDGGATDFQVDDGRSGPAFFRWVDRDGSVNYTDEASVPDWARASAKRTSGDPITIAPRGACQSAAPTRN